MAAAISVSVGEKKGVALVNFGEGCLSFSSGGGGSVGGVGTAEERGAGGRGLGSGITGGGGPETEGACRGGIGVRKHPKRHDISWELIPFTIPLHIHTISNCRVIQNEISFCIARSYH